MWNQTIEDGILLAFCVIIMILLDTFVASVFFFICSCFFGYLWLTDQEDDDPEDPDDKI